MVVVEYRDDDSDVLSLLHGYYTGVIFIFFCPRAGVLEGGPHGGKCKSIAAITIRTATATALRSDCTDEEQPQARKGKLVRHFYAAQDSAKMAG